MIINHNVPALVTNNALKRANTAADKSSKRLSTGSRINTAADDAAGLAISNKMKTQCKGLEMADRNCNDAISLIQTAEGGMAEIQNMLQRMRELSLQGGSDTLTTSDREKIQIEVDQLVEEITDTAGKVQYNTKHLLDNTDTLTFQIGPNVGLVVDVDMQDLKAGTLSVTGLNYKDADACRDANLVACDNAISDVSELRAKLGAVQNRLEYTSSSLGVANENTQVALSRVQDTDMAGEMTEYTKNNVIIQAGVSMLAQANQRPNQLLQLLQ